MAEISFQQTQRTSQIQSQKMSQRQIYSLSLLSMNSQELRSEVFSAVDKNPALEIDKDPLNGVSSVSKISKNFSDNLHYGSSSARGQEKADAFQEIQTRFDFFHDLLGDHVFAIGQFQIADKIIRLVDGKLAKVHNIQSADGDRQSDLVQSVAVTIRAGRV